MFEKNGITKYFKEVEIAKEYEGYYYSILKAIMIVILGSICELRNINQLHRWSRAKE